MSLAGARLLARWCPVCRWRESGLRLLCGTREGVCRYCAPGCVRVRARGSVSRSRNYHVPAGRDRKIEDLLRRLREHLEPDRDAMWELADTTTARPGQVGCQVRGAEGIDFIDWNSAAALGSEC
jgi:hypothetical protein